MDKPKRFIECTIPVTVCNLECPYCYVIQENRRSMKIAELKYPPTYIAKALRKERLGGVCWINICGSGETFAQIETSEIVKLLLEEGHYVNVTTNGTLSKRIRDLVNSVPDYTNHLHFSFSFHYTELIKHHFLDDFFDNIQYVKAKGASFVLQLNLCDEYLPYLNEIKRISLEKVGALPQVALTRDELSTPLSHYSKMSFNDYKSVGDTFESQLFDFTCKNFNVRRTEFCYAGDWSAVLDLSNGHLRKCYNETKYQDIFRDINEPIRFSAIGYGCKNMYCFNSSHFLSLGVIPNLDTPSYYKLRNRAEANWYGKEMAGFLNSKLSMSNERYSSFRMCLNKIFTLSKKYWTIFNLKFLQRIKYNVKFIIEYLFPLGKKALILGSSEHENLGDSAIVIAEKKFLENCGYSSNHIKEITYTEYIGGSGLIKRYISKKWLICGLGGGSMGNQWFYDEEMRRSFIKDFPNNRIIIFPQTLFYSNDEEGKKEESNSIPIYEGHKKLSLFAREKTSYDLMKSLYPNTKVFLSPDIVLSTDLNDYGIISQCRKGILLVFRSDAEKNVELQVVKQIEKSLTESEYSYRITDTNVGIFAHKKNRLDLVKKKLQEFADSKLVITDRLHGMVFSVITGTPCIVFNNYNHKVLGTYEWIKDLDYVKFANSADEAIGYIPKLLNMQSCSYDKNMLKTSFETLKKEISQA